MRSAVGPSLNWYDEYVRYTTLFEGSVDGSLTRRFAMFTMLFALALIVYASSAMRRFWARRRPNPAPAHHNGVEHVLPHVHPNQVDTPLRYLRWHRRCDCRARRCGSVTDCYAFPACKDFRGGIGGHAHGYLFGRLECLVVRVFLRHSMVGPFRAVHGH